MQKILLFKQLSLNGSLEYLDEWTGTRNLSTYVTYGDLTVIEPSNNEGNLELNISGMINVNRKNIERKIYMFYEVDKHSGIPSHSNNESD